MADKKETQEEGIVAHEEVSAVIDESPASPFVTPSPVAVVDRAKKSSFFAGRSSGARGSRDGSDVYKRQLPVLATLGKRAAGPVKKLVLSAVANAVHNNNANKDTLFIAEIRVDESATLKRSMPRARGRAFPIKKRTSRIFVRLAEKPVVAEATVAPAEKSKTTKKT